MNGLWSLVLDFQGRRGGAAIVINDGKILGGDSGMTYVGSIRIGDNGDFSGTIQAEQFIAHADAFFPGVRSFEVTIAGKYENDRLSGVATVSLAPGRQIKLTGSRKAAL